MQERAVEREVLECFAGLHAAVQKEEQQQEEHKEEQERGGEGEQEGGEDEEENVPLQAHERTPIPA